LDRLEERRVCAWVGEEAVAMDEGGGGGGGFPGSAYADGMFGQPPAAIEGAAQAGGPWSKAPQWPIREGETGFPFADDVLAPIGQQQTLPPLGEAAGGSNSGQPNGGQPVIAGGKIVPVFTEEELAQLAEYLGMDQPPSSPGPLPPSPTVTPKPTSFGGSPTTTQGSTTTGGSPATVAATTGAVNDSPFIQNGVCTGLPAFAGPDVYTTNASSTTIYSNGYPAFRQLNDQNNEGLIVGLNMDQQSRQINQRPFNEANDRPTAAIPDSIFFDDSHYAWVEIVSYRTYNKYYRVPGATLSNATPNPATLRMSISRTTSNTWTQGGSLGGSLGRELTANAEAIEGRLSNSLQASVSVSRSENESTTYARELGYTVSPCDVLSLYEGYMFVELQVDYILMDDTIFGDVDGFEVKRGTAYVTSQYYTGIHGLAASTWVAMERRSGDMGATSR
jgi:hypothetical protein